MPGAISIPVQMVDSAKECMYSCGEAVTGKAELVDGKLVARVLFESAL